MSNIFDTQKLMEKGKELYDYVPSQVDIVHFTLKFEYAKFKLHELMSQELHIHIQ